MSGRQIKPRWVRRDQTWVAAVGDYDEDRQRYRDEVLRDERGEKIPERDRNAAEAAVYRIKQAREASERQREGPTVADVIAAYLDWQKARGSKPGTVEDHTFHLGKFGVFTHDGVPYQARAAASIGVKDLTRVRTAMEVRGNQSGYVRHLYNSVLACWRWACRPVEGREPEKMIEVNPFDGLKRPPGGRGKKTVLPWPVIARVLDYADTRATRCYGPTRERSRLKALALRLIAESGCRPKEAMDLEWDWVFEDDRCVVIPWEWHKTGWRNRQDRFFGLSPEMAARLSALRQSGESHGRWVFGGAADPLVEPPTCHALWAYFRDVRAGAIGSGIPLPADVTLYTLRRSLVTAAKKGGVEFSAMSPHMGHSKDVAEQHYHQPDKEAAREAYDKMDEARRKGQRGGDVTPPP